jgi:acetoin utilization deacetylase AcuC-like enzyme
MRVTRGGFAAMARRLRRAADLWSGGRAVVVLEGGYDLDGLAGGMTAVLDAFAGKTPEPEPLAALPAADQLARAAIDGTLRAHADAGTPIPDAESARG